MDCPLCQCTRAIPFFEENGFSVLRCVECAMVYVSNPPTVDHLQDMYDREQWLDADGAVARDDTAYQRNAPMLLAMSNEGLDMISETTSLRGGRLLDVGCGDGHFLIAASERGFEAEGVELSRARVRRATAAGLAVHHGDLLELDLPAASFDLVSCRDVLSHVTQPVAMMQAVRRLLAPGGIVFLQTGNKAELETKHDGEPLFDFWGVPGHLSFFGEPQLKRMFEESGLTTVEVRRVPYLQWQFEPRLLAQDEGRFPAVRKTLAAVGPLRRSLVSAYRWYWYRGRTEAQALWITARAV